MLEDEETVHKGIRGRFSAAVSGGEVLRQEVDPHQSRCVSDADKDRSRKY
ncbi:MAG: hypothetical protein U5R30_15200 [Deltaproteobacteria bacterium]|nr:hypothetical protein [Deltaproteobacteria bacterium]